jgi:hypothetical protein
VGDIMAKLLGIIIGLAALTLAGAGAQAAPTDDSSEVGSALAGAVDASASAQTEAAPVKPPNPLAKYLDPADELVGGMRLRSDQVQEWLRAARRAGYRDRSICLNDMLSQSHALEREADLAQHSAEKAVEQNDGHSVLRELVHLYVYDQRSRVLVNDAQWCGVARRRATPSAMPWRSAEPGGVAQPRARTGYVDRGTRTPTVR